LERGGIGNVIEPRIYRAAFLPALLALVLVAFSLESPPKPLDQGLAADALFEGESAVALVQSIVQQAPDRAAGSAGDKLVAGRVAKTFTDNGFTTQVDRWREEDRDLVNVVGRRAGDSTKQIVVLAARDSAGSPDATDSAAGTAALMEFSRVFQGRALGRTLVLASVDGGQIGDAGARRFAERITNPDTVEAVIVLSDLGAKESRGPIVIDWSNDTTRAGVGLRKTVTASLRGELKSVPDQEATIPQFVRLAFPIAPGAQGVLLTHGLDAVRVSGSGEVSRGGDKVGDIGVDRYGALGRSVLRMIATLDGSEREPARGPKSFVGLGGMLLPDWALKLLALALILPALVASIDALARARRRREPVAPWFGWLAMGIVPFLAAVMVAWLMAITGLIENAPPGPLDPAALEVDGTAIGALVATSFTALLAWALLRTRVVRRAHPPADASAPGAGCATSLVLAAIALPIALLNPYAGLMLVPAVHLWMLATLTDVRSRTGIVLALIGFLPVLFVVGYYTWRFELSPVEAGWYLLLLVTGNQTGVLTTIALCVLLGITISVAAILFARTRQGGGGEDRRPRGGRRQEEARPSIFGPGGYAGPGALGQVGSGNRR
jgi:hypothetical protein